TLHALCLPPMPSSPFSHDLAPPPLYTLSLHDALPICPSAGVGDDNAGPETFLLRRREVRPRPQCAFQNLSARQRSPHLQSPQDASAVTLTAAARVVRFPAACTKDWSPSFFRMFPAPLILC